MQRRTVTLSIILISTLAGCSSKDAMLPVPPQDMLGVYNAHSQGTGDSQLFDRRSALRRGMEEGDVKLSDYVRDEKNQLESKFKTLPNPTLYMFVAPHLAADTEVPIPGYLTEFKMWPREHYALPGEISDMSSAYQSQSAGNNP